MRNAGRATESSFHTHQSLIYTVEPQLSGQHSGVGSKISLVRPLKPRPRPHPRLHLLMYTYKRIAHGYCRGRHHWQQRGCIRCCHSRSLWTTPTFREILVRPWPEWPERFLRPCSMGPIGARMCENAHNSEYSTEETDRCDFPSSSILITSSFLSRVTTLRLRVTEAIT